jgi:peptidoglycan/LPS O-acetylase OafA/YrhL
MRAVAVLAVVLFHARLGLSGGYVGVDIFFVVSGYLITGIILKDIDQGSFSLKRFWERRVRRIFPALLVVVACTTIAGWFILLPSDFLDLGKSVAVQSVFGANVFFWWTSGYFEAVAASKPLLHTWSLAVEEQYYLIVPLLVLFRLTASRRALFGVLSFILVLSLGLSIFLTWRSPSAAFYLLPTRAWEISLGSLLAVLPSQTILPVVQRIVGWGGALVVLASFVLFDKETPFPGSAALLPTLGAAALIWANSISSTPTLLRQVLSARPVVFIGKISYSLYLWHWPLLIYSEYWALNPLRWYMRILVVLASMILATLSWRLIETPFRTRRVLPGRRRLFAFGLAPLGCYLCLGIAVELLHGAPGRFPAVAEQYANGKYDFPFKVQTGLIQAKRGEYAMVGDDSPSQVHCMVWGDSHAMAVVPAIERLARESESRAAVATHFATAPILGVTCTSEVSLQRDSGAWGQAIVDYVKEQRIPDVLLVCRWRTYESIALIGDKKCSPNDLAEKLQETVFALQNAGAKVWILKEVPTYNFNVPRALARAAIRREPMTRMGMHEDEYARTSSAEDKLLEPAVHQGAIILDPHSVFVNRDRFCAIEDSGFSLYRDSDHLSSHGAMMLKPLFRRIWYDPDSKVTIRPASASGGNIMTGQHP